MFTDDKTVQTVDVVACARPSLDLGLEIQDLCKPSFHLVLLLLYHLCIIHDVYIFSLILYFLTRTSTNNVGPRGKGIRIDALSFTSLEDVVIL